MDEKTLFCLGNHFKFMYEATIVRRLPDMAEPCMKCKYAQAGTCDINHHLKVMEQLHKQCGIVVNVWVKEGDKCAENATDSADCQD